MKGKGIYAGELGKYLGDIGSVPLVDDKQFKALLRAAGKKDPVMATVQDAFFEEEYFRPALIKENPSIPPFAKGGFHPAMNCRAQRRLHVATGRILTQGGVQRSEPASGAPKRGEDRPPLG